MYHISVCLCPALLVLIWGPNQERVCQWCLDCLHHGCSFSTLLMHKTDGYWAKRGGDQTHDPVVWANLCSVLTLPHLHSTKSHRSLWCRLQQLLCCINRHQSSRGFCFSLFIKRTLWNINSKLKRDSKAGQLKAAASYDSVNTNNTNTNRNEPELADKQCKIKL